MCVFCDLQKKAVKDNAMAYFIYDKNPVSPGHALIIPKRHAETVFDCAHIEWAGMGLMVRAAKDEIEKTFNPKPIGYNIKINCGADAGQQIMHAHIHLIPKYE